ncbi:VOC family protein [Pseudomonas sp. JS3066]|uniref:VOC family protein n=1 Tax=unclassified Pseudomonas TaxID=196821 RepID=UPI000EA89BDB|nr:MULTISPECIES: VOC family protein [unclassified Pseudomonas]AYF88509.1 glyoxalase [Pseudomonas sp. DY-1]MDH4656583.1 glyoxalase [Pseudomonas sp. BN606]MRK23497.1 glyoxalase [Pseudomonas sp. JG-B]WVK93954.1 VOC family protein [Pseudomonas sp. JS3066]
MSTLDTIEIKAFVPAKDYAQSKDFYRELGFEMCSTSDEVSYFRYGHSAFLLQNFYSKEFAENLMMHLQVKDVESWWQHVQTSGVIERYGLRVVPPQDQPWRMRDFVLIDPSGVLWRIGQNI